MGIFGNKKEKAKYIVLGKKKYAFELLSKEMKVNRVTEDIRVEEQTHNRFEMLYKNRKHKAEIIEKKQNKYIVEINGNRYSFSIETPISYQRKKMLEKNQDKESGIIVTAPMPGKILEIMVSEGQGVKEGETLVILEAMKMQNEILALSSGKVEAIAVKPGDSVMKDDRLLELR